LPAPSTATNAPTAEHHYGDEFDAYRAENYDVRSLLLASPPNQALLDLLSGLQGDDSALGRSWSDIAQASSNVNPRAIAKEHFELFTGVGRGELLPYASFYITGFLHERPLAEIRGDLARLGITRQAGDHEPEDRLALLLSIMAAFIRGALPTDQGSADAPDAQHFFSHHLAPWAELFFDDLEKAPAADFYRYVARIGRAFIAAEKQAFALGTQEAAATKGGH